LGSSRALARHQVNRQTNAADLAAKLDAETQAATVMKVTTCLCPISTGLHSRLDRSYCV
jgi:hypothetical protein